LTKVKVWGFITKMENEIIIGGELKMKLSKIVKKITSISLAAALAVSGINYQPAKAEAAELPVVTVLGATLSLDADAGKQSMRVAIQVENADNASACGMSITYNGKKLDFSTDDGVNNKLYDADADTNTIVYAVKIANIPSENFKDNFTIEGYATPIAGAEEGEKVTTEAPVEKSVDGVVAAIAEKDDSINMKDSKLVKKVASLDIANVASLPSSGDDKFILSAVADVGYSVAEYDSENDCAIISTCDMEDNEASFTGNNSNGSNQVIGLVYKFVQGRGLDYIIETTVDNTDNMEFIGSWAGTIAPKSSVKDGDWVKLSYEINAGGWWDYGYRTRTPKTYKLKQYDIYKVLTSGDLADTKLDKGFVTLSAQNQAASDYQIQITYENDKANVSLAPIYGGYGAEYYIKTDKSVIDISEYKVVVNITSEASYPMCFRTMNGYTNGQFFGNGATAANATYRDLQIGTHDYEFTNWTGNAQSISVKYNSNNNDNPKAVFTINSIRVVKK